MRKVHSGQNENSTKTTGMVSRLEGITTWHQWTNIVSNVKIFNVSFVNFMKADFR